MQLDAEIKDDNYADMPRQQEAQYAHPSSAYLKSDAATGQNYVDLNAAAKSYSGAWLFGKENVECFVGNLKAQWMQWCPVPAGINDGVLMKGNVIYQNADGSYRMSTDMYEGVIRTEHSERYFEGRTQHTFYGRNLPGGQMRVVANLKIPLNQQLPYNPMIQMPSAQAAAARSYASYQTSQQPAQSGAWGQSGWGQVNTGYGGGGQYPQANTGYGGGQYPQAGYLQSSGGGQSYGEDPDGGF